MRQEIGPIGNTDKEENKEKHASIMLKKLCNKCHQNRKLSSFTHQMDGTNGLRSVCKNCDKRLRNDYGKRLRQTVFDHYGPCVYCKISDQDILTIDHINNDGAIKRKTREHSKGYHFYGWIIRNNFPTDLQALCWNCQYKKRLKYRYEKEMAAMGK
jgi:hypothetical protein